MKDLRKIWRESLKAAVSRQFCVWLVPSDSGTVRKLRFSASRGLALLFAVSVLVGAGLVIAGDYSRVQIARFRDALSLMSLQSEHEELQSEAEQLTARIHELRQKNRSIESQQLAVLQRLGELNEVLGSLKVGPESNSAGRDSGISRNSSINNGDGLTDIGGEEPDSKGWAGDALELPSEPDAQGTGGLETSLDAITKGFTVPDLEPYGPEEVSALVMHELDQTIERFRGVPLGFPGNGHVNSEFGPRRSPFSKRTRMHHGVDLALPYGSYVHVTAEGTVSSVRRTRSYGLVIDVKHDSGIVTRYAHLSKTLVRRGERVCRGEVLGLVGNSGMSTGPHLHYEIRVAGKSINPLPLMVLPSRDELVALLKG
ncbi:hypothetical protein EBR25_08795 [bacterium]|nr:hypothetical protein [bacterium]